MTYLSITQTAQRLGVTRQSVWSRIDRGIIKAERIGNGWAIPDTEVQRIEGGAYVAESESTAKK